MIGQKISHFRIVEKIDEGGMGVVYQAEDENLGRMVALKVLPPDFARDDERRRRFIREARLAASVTHPYIATIHEVDEHEAPSSFFHFRPNTLLGWHTSSRERRRPPVFARSGN